MLTSIRYFKTIMISNRVEELLQTIVEYQKYMFKYVDNDIPDIYQIDLYEVIEQ